ncbi:MAG: AAA family ATPase [Candidatus Aenigmatarchaeota archaeon]
MLYIVRTKDFKRVIAKIVKSIQKENIEKNTSYLIKIYSEGIETFEGETFSKESFIKNVKERKEIVYIFRNFCPFSTDELIHLCERYILEKFPIRIYIVSPDFEIAPALEPYVEIIEDYLPSQEEVDTSQYPYVEGLTLAQLKKVALLQKDPLEERKNILKKSGGVLEIYTPKEVERAVGLEDIIETFEDLKGKGKGALLLGVPGTGKTLIAKNLAKKHIVVRFNFSAIYQKYVGESEKKLRETIAILEQFGDCFLFIDEFEKALSTGSGDSGVSKRILGEFLSWLEDRHTKQYLIATMNDLTSLPLELIRPGRWDMILGLTPPPRNIRTEIIKYYAEKYNLDIDQKLINTNLLTPADIATYYRLWSILGKERARRFVKWTKDLHPNFHTTLELVYKYATPVWNEDEVEEKGGEDDII